MNPFTYQPGISDPSVFYGDDPHDAHVVHAIGEAHRLGLKVMLKPHVWLRRASAAEWRGVIGMDTEADWQAWFTNYGKCVLHYAAMPTQTMSPCSVSAWSCRVPRSRAKRTGGP